MNNNEIAQFILGMVDMSVASELPEEEHLEYLMKDLESIKETNLYYYLESACARNTKETRKECEN